MAWPPGTRNALFGANSQGASCDIGAFEYEVEAASPGDFVITAQTDNAGTSTSTQFTIPTTGTGYNYNVDCNNDGTNEATAQTGNYTCNYATAGTYTMRIKDNSGAGNGFPRIYFNNGGDKLKLLTIEQWGTGKWTSMNSAFRGCSYMTVPANDTCSVAPKTSTRISVAKTNHHFCSPDALIQGIREVMAGNMAMPDYLLNHLPSMVHRQQEGKLLSQREIEVLKLITQGQSNRMIAQALHISENTIVSHVARILDKLGLENRTQAALYARRRGLV